MASWVIYAHGGRDAGTATGTYIVPKGVTIYFFEKDEQYLYNNAAKVIMNTLLTGHPDEAAVQAIAKETKTAYQSVPNYQASGDPNIAGMGVYLVGLEPAVGQLVAIPAGTKKRMSDIIGGSGRGGVLGDTIYWLACRAAPTNSNVFAATTGDKIGTSTGVMNLNAVNVTPDSGLKPSVVRAIGGRWRT